MGCTQSSTRHSSRTRRSLNPITSSGRTTFGGSAAPHSEDFRPGARVIVLAGHTAAGMTGTLVSVDWRGTCMIDLDFTGETVFVPKVMVETESPIDNLYFSESGATFASLDRRIDAVVGDRVEIVGEHELVGKRGFITEAVSIGPDDTLYTIALDDGTKAHAGQEYVKMAEDGATRASATKAERDDKGIDAHLLAALKDMGGSKEWALARTTLASLKPGPDDTTAECALCCEDLCDSPTAVLVKSDGSSKVRVCRHYYHVSCLRDMFLTKSLEKRCPLCREEFEHYVPLPDLKKEPKLWFKVVDSRGDGHLSLEEAVAATQSILPVSQYSLTDLLKKDDNKLWLRWAKTNGETITLHDFFRLHGGFFVWLLANLRELHRLKMNDRKMPNLFTSDGDCDIENAWFDYWDFTGAGVLTKQQLERALTIAVVARGRGDKSKGTAMEGKMNMAVSEVVEALWEDIAPQKDGLIMRNSFHAAVRLLLPNVVTLVGGIGRIGVKWRGSGIVVLFKSSSTREVDV
ncbi:hypothetical protein Pmar_PMAR026888 [Perkinsus marinus ATCC 50983]|uniref:RING-type domain-containing protein n=1 Tax=Perkinsus marinus (strain ATCC 50983 / TXsc) TaxID=423536 RepID=C5LUR4_PERM5|nr:hypothetical protein Pmar_PMAR026888 [Perkinsus marinus ATCC 50983]EEQ99522.1 hypothetical protein Pmar_PMAR026888 [Perkinsus marinus ATCC 50983]|eukprot:XP_002766805.1 hypothetical protein Pmar_PMAR026888 [Perkinsus marinus ATCC 50983]